MISYIVIDPYKDDFQIILHAAPNMQGKFDWRVKNAPADASFRSICQGNGYESISAGKEQLREYEGQYIYCHCLINGQEYDEPGIHISSNILKTIAMNIFDMISFYDENGMIRSDVKYKAKTTRL